MTGLRICYIAREDPRLATVEMLLAEAAKSSDVDIGASCLCALESCKNGARGESGGVSTVTAAPPSTTARGAASTAVVSDGTLAPAHCDVPGSPCCAGSSGNVGGHPNTSPDGGGGGAVTASAVTAGVVTASPSRPSTAKPDWWG